MTHLTVLVVASVLSASTSSTIGPNPNQQATRSPNHNDASGLFDTPIVEIEGHTIGDNHRSATSSKSFFDSVDKDGDEILGRSELSHFLYENIGGSSLDEESEVEREITSIMKRLDLNRDDGLDSKDVFGYWKSVESLLTVEEVAEWVVHAVQLPEEIGRIFRENHVTAYDFVELVDDDGEALLRELNIEKNSFRRKIVRQIKALLLGVGR